MNGYNIAMLTTREGFAMALTRKQFYILTQALSENLTQRALREKTGMSLGTINRTIRELTDLGCMRDGRITEAGIQALEPYRARRAVFIAAGFGTRLVPITFNTPKPLVRVHGQRIIDGLIDACLGAGIEEIYIVRGYLGEQFDLLLRKYPMLKFIENPEYNEANNIASALMARDLLSNAYVLEADLLINNPKLIQKYQYASNYLGVRTTYTDDWCFRVKNGIIQKVLVGGDGDDIWCMCGISYWTEADGRKLSSDIEAVYRSPGGKERYWDEVPLLFCRDHYLVELRECNDGDLIEIDTYRELRQIDKTYDV